VANTLDLFRYGAVGFIDWLDLFSDHFVFEEVINNFAINGHYAGIYHFVIAVWRAKEAESHRMKFFSLNDGTVINLDAIAYFHRDPRPQIPPRARIEIVFASACRNEVGGIDSLTLVLDEQDTGAFLDEMVTRGVNVQHIRNSFRDVLEHVAREGSR
jgi:hypothetical protein